jgi:hypothetical protein
MLGKSALLSATGITWMAIRGDDALRIQQRAGHEDFQTTQGYIREAEAIREGFGNVFPPLPAALINPGNSTDEAQKALGRNVQHLDVSAGVANYAKLKRNGGVDGTRARVDSEISAAASSSVPVEARSDARSRPFVAGTPPFETTDAEMVNAVARAMLEGRGELAEFLMREVRQRRERAASNVVPIQSKRPG